LGVASVASGIALKRMMEEYKISGTIRVYGCPSEETLYGKVIMASEKVFNDLDAALQWHPGTLTTSPYESLNALDNKIYKFYGKSAHASTPWEGKSALDTAQLFALGIEFAREHMAEKDKIHYVITRGGNMPNIVPDFAEVWVFIRSSDMNRLIELSNKVDLCAVGASLSTETSFEIERKIGCHLLLPNKKLSLTVGENLKLVGAPKLDEREKEFIDTRLSNKYEEFSDEVTPPSGWEEGGEWVGKPISTDVGDVSWIVPTNGMFNVSTAPKGVPYHNPDVTILSNTSIGFKGMLVAAKTLACTGIDLLTNQEILAQAKDEFRRRKELQKWNYEPLLPAKIEYPKYGWKPTIVPK
jgi:aminobenzoyl-glutamate utilization protein B